LSAWPTLVEWRREDAEGARFRDQLCSAARQWRERGRSKGLLWRGDALTEFKMWRARYPGKMTEDEETIAAAGLQEANRGRLRKRFAASAVISVLIAGLIALLWMNRQVENRLLDNYEEQGRSELLNGAPERAMVYLNEAYRAGRDNPSLRFLIAQSMHPIDARLDYIRFSLNGHEESVRWVDYSRDGSRIVTAGDDKTARVWDAATGRLLLTIEGHTQGVLSAVFSSDAKRICTSGRDNSIKVWDAATGNQLVSIEMLHNNVHSALFSPDGTRIVAADVILGTEAGSAVSSSVKIWDASNGKLLQTISRPNTFLI